MSAYSDTLCQNQIVTSWVDERVDEGECEMNKFINNIKRSDQSRERSVQ